MRNLNHIFNPQSVALIGATDRPGSVGLGISQNLLKSGKERKVFFVNPYQEKVLGYQTFPKITSVGGNVDLAIIAVPAKIVPQVTKECCEKKVGGIIIISSGFAENNKEGILLQEEITKMVKENNIPLIGPNCLGIIRPSINLNASFAPLTPQKGEIAFLSQSGALIDSVIDKSLIEHYGFSTIISYGNEADLEISDFLKWAKKDKETKVIILYLEGLRNGREFMEAAKEVLKQKPIIAIKAGKTQVGKTAIRTHTASLAGDYKIYSAAFCQAGIIEAETIEELFDMAKALSWQPTSKNGVGILTNGGGCGVLMADYCQSFGIKLSRLKKETIQKMDKSGKMYPAYPKQNPLDIGGDALPERYKIAIDSLLEQKDIYGILIIQTLQIMTDSKENAKIIVEAKKRWPKKPIVCSFLGGEKTLPGIKILEENRIPNYSDLKRAARAMRVLIK